jgi:selenocysteine-specific elongation factor
MRTPSLVLGTAGHIDHGKSSLIKALTGTDPDRLAEEKARGITIELGFAQLELPSGRTVGVVDVPGHEKFVRQMVAGATGIDVVLFVVAADDGVMPQTREHLAIIDLLGIDKGVVALTKADLADEEWVELVRSDVEELISTTSIAGAPIVAVSSKTGAGLPELLAAIEEMAVGAPTHQASLPFRLPVDRVFTISGAGTVVTGTLWSGQVAKDDPVEIVPGDVRGRVRGVQVHSQTVDKASAGQRVAINIAGVEKAEISRGDIIAAPETLTVTDRFDARFTYLGTPGDDRAFETGTRVHVHHGTRVVLGRVLLMDDEALVPGSSGLAQVRLEEPLAPRYDDRFVVRSYSPVYTIGGGVVLDVSPPRRTNPRAEERALLEALLAHDLSAAAVRLLASRAVPMTSAQVATAIGVPRSAVADDLNRAPLGRLKVAGETYFADTAALERLHERVAEEIAAFHAGDPKAVGIATLALRDRVDKRLAPKLFDALLETVVEKGVVVVEKGLVRDPHSSAGVLAAQEDAVAALLPLLEKQGLAPDGVEDLAKSAGIDTGLARKALGSLASRGDVVRVAGDMYFAASAVARAREQVVSYLKEHETMFTTDVKQVLGISRKFAIPLLEHFDAQGVTRREAGVRTLKKA